MVTASITTTKSIMNVSQRLHRWLRNRRSSKNHGSFTTAATAPPPTNVFSRLPAEIKQAIFSTLPNVASLQALILTCSFLYHCFLDSESLILAEVLQNEIPRGLLQDAFAALKSSEMTPWNQQTADNLKTLYTTYERPSLPLRWSLRTAIALSEMHGHVEFFANRFVSSTFSLNPVTGNPQSKYVTASASELIRIQRAIYRFEFYCNLSAFREKRDDGCSDIYASNFHKYAPWENEQLACIREHLIQAVLDRIVSLTYERTIISRKLIYLALDTLPEDGERLIQTSYSLQVSNPIGSFPWHDIPLGLRLLRQFICATSYKERRRLTQNQPLCSETFFVFHSGTISDIPLSNMDSELQRIYIHPPFANDDDRGPEEAWRWAHADCRPSNWFNFTKHKGLRDMGYVMWDFSRLAESGILEREVDKIVMPEGLISLLGQFRTACWSVGG